MDAYLHKSGTKYTWSGGFETKDLPKQAGFRWDPAARYWWTSFIDTAAKLAKYGDAATKAELEAYLATKERSISASHAASADIDLPVPDGLDYLPFQKAGIQYALQRDNVLFGDDMGLGKTVEAIGVVNAKPDIKSVLVVAPASLKLNWKRELGRWLVRQMSVAVANGSLPDTDIVIVNYDILGKHANKLKARQWDMVIADEAHYVKNPKAQRTQHLLGKEVKKDGKYVQEPGIIASAKRRVFLTGTPILNRPIEVWPIAHALAPTTFPSFMSFAKRYADAKEGKYGWDFSGASNLGELQEKLRTTIMVRRLKKDVLTELPPKRRQVVELEPDGEARKVVAREQEVSRQRETELRRLRVDVELAKAAEDDKTYEEAVAKLKAAAQVAFEDISRERHEVALAKVPQVIEYMKDMLEQQDKIVVFAHHKDVVDLIVAAFPGVAVRHTGDDSLEDRDKAKEAFQKNPETRLFIGSIATAGMGLTLTAASTVIFAELDWVPGNLTQAEDRLHRIGQADSVLVQHLVFDGSLDSKMAKTLVEKQVVIDKALDIEPPPATPIDEPETMKVSRKALADFEDMPDTEVAATLSALRLLAGVDDGAVTKDDAGFNRIDTMIGRRLASQPSLTQKQARLGAVLVQKYKGQLERAGLVAPKMPQRKQPREAVPSVAQAALIPTPLAPAASAVPAAPLEPAAVTAPTGPSFEITLEGYSVDWKNNPKHIAHNKEAGQFPIAFPYDAALVSAVKSIPGVRFNRDTKNWDLADAAASMDAIRLLAKFAASNGFSFSPGARDTIKEAVEKAGGKLVVKEALSEYEQKKAKGIFTVSAGDGYGGRPFTIGESLLWKHNRPEELTGKVITVLSASSRYFREDGLSFGVGDDRGYLYTADVRLATDAEAKAVLDTERQKEELKQQGTAFRESIKSISRAIQKFGTRPDGRDNVPEGETILSTQTIYGGGDWFVLGDKEIWYVRNNGGDGDDWSANNVRTGGAGAVGWKIDHTRPVADKLRALAEVDKMLRARSKVADDVARTAFGELPEPVYSGASLSMTELKAIEDQRPNESRMQDEMLSHVNTVASDDDTAVESWLGDPGSADIWGVDTPTVPGGTPRRQRKSPARHKRDTESRPTEIGRVRL